MSAMLVDIMLLKSWLSDGAREVTAETRLVNPAFREGISEALADIVSVRADARIGTRETDAERLADRPAIMLSEGTRDADAEIRLVRS